MLEIYIPTKWLDNKIALKNVDHVLFTWVNSNGTNFQFGNDDDVKSRFEKIISSAGKTMHDRGISGEKDNNFSGKIYH